MKAIYQNKLYWVLGASTDLVLEDDKGHVAHVPLDAPSLILDPSDDELKEVENLPLAS